MLTALATQVKLMAEVKVIRRWHNPAGRQFVGKPENEPVILKRIGKTKVQLIAIASSTGGPGVLANILGQLPPDMPVPVLIVQHITSGFGQGLATWLNKQTSLEVRLAQHNDKPQAGQVLIAPDGQHMVVNRLGIIQLTNEPAQQGLRPAADRLFNSVAQVYGASVVGVILSGMGRDGAAGLQAIRQCGAHTIAQDEETCAVFGMPAVAIALGAAEQVLPASQIAAALMDLL